MFNNQIQKEVDGLIKDGILFKKSERSYILKDGEREIVYFDELDDNYLVSCPTFKSGYSFGNPNAAMANAISTFYNAVIYS